MTATVPRAMTVVLAVAVVLAGLGARAVLPGAVGGPVGDALYATLVVLLVILVRPRTSPAVAAVIGFTICLTIEFFQLTGIPVAVAERFPLARLVLGTTFWAPDLLRYAVGAALGGALSGALSGALRGAATRRVAEEERRARHGSNG
ncbi:DUF2809 domain-containing protein [Myceligenerans xiligouense]|uniref:Uncharacterized protein DUF2809 n=1 Tax=Myceligenerans xiligouense TaxID=253184 RepID=A0A3N4YKC4_9MICO|nr:DUF2809 domain-containing protein [Myceligenerans xiligouense]RPF19876.1 uncharacterized protein DUF2809 [Myceligenerans xiligouense]